MATAPVVYFGLTNTPADYLLNGMKWNTNFLSYSFPDVPPSGTWPGSLNNSFASVTEAMKNYARKTFLEISNITNLTFTEASTNNGQDGVLRLSRTFEVPTATGYYPNVSEVGGDMWFRRGNYDDPVLGTFAAETIIHEIGHALGLKHGHESSGAFSALPFERDSNEFSVMTYRDHIGDNPNNGSANAWDANEQTYMMYDILALQEMYGADYSLKGSTSSGKTTYSFSSTTGEMFINGISQGDPIGNVIFRTIWDGNGHDTYDLSNYSTNLQLDLRPGEFSNFGQQIGYLGDGFWARGNVGNAMLFHGNIQSLIEAAIGGSGSDKIIGNQADNILRGNTGNDLLEGWSGNDWMEGGEGNDTLIGGDGDDKLVGGTGLNIMDGGSGFDCAIFSGLCSQYSVVWDTALPTLEMSIKSLTTGAIDNIKAIERLVFDDTWVNTLNLSKLLEESFNGMAGKHELVLNNASSYATRSDLPDIRGPFKTSALVRFDNLDTTTNQRIFEVSSTTGNDKIYLGQNASSHDMIFGMVKNGITYKAIAKGTIIEGEDARWVADINEQGLMRLYKDDVKVAQSWGAVPSDTSRPIELIGRSTSSNDSLFNGAIYDISTRDNPNDIHGAFTAKVTATFDNLANGSWQRLFDFGNGPGLDNIYLGQSGNSNNMIFMIVQDGKHFSVSASNSIVQGELATWIVDVNDLGVMRIYKNGTLLAEGNGVVPKDVERVGELIGESHWAEDTPLIGSVTSIEILSKNRPIPPVESIKPPVTPVILPEKALPQIDLKLPGLTDEQLNFLVSVYVGSFNRAPDYAGLDYWSTNMVQLHEKGVVGLAAIQDIATSMYQAGKQNGELGSTLDNDQYVDHLYKHVLGRDADPEGRAWWVSDLTTGTARESFLVTYLMAALEHSSDASYLSSRMTVAKLASAVNHTGKDINLIGVLDGVTNSSSAITKIAQLQELYSIDKDLIVMSGLAAEIST